MPRSATAAMVFSALAVALSGIALTALTGQAQERATLPGQTGGAATRPRTATAQAAGPQSGSAGNLSAPAGAPAAAAVRNKTLETTLEWMAGDKPQRGWTIYVPLIRRLINTEAAADSTDFARALAGWQSRVGLAPSGILDAGAWYRMIQTWQAQRSKEHDYPRPDQLLTAPPSDFYHPERPSELRQVELKTYAAYRRMVAAAAADRSLGLRLAGKGELAPAEQYLKIISAFRSREYQEQLRKQAPGAGRAALAVNSPHFTGRALDLYVGGEPVDSSDYNRAIQVRTPVYRWLVRNAWKFGFVPYYYEPWHWEYRPLP